MFHKGREQIVLGSFATRRFLNEYLRSDVCYVFVVHRCVLPTVLAFLDVSGDGVATVVRIGTLVDDVVRDVDAVCKCGRSFPHTCVVLIRRSHALGVPCTKTVLVRPPTQAQSMQTQVPTTFIVG